MSVPCGSLPKGKLIVVERYFVDWSNFFARFNKFLVSLVIVKKMTEDIGCLHPTLLPYT